MYVERLSGIGQVDEAAWRALEPPSFPFFDYEFLRALERSGSIGGASGWAPTYLVCRDAGCVLGALPLYLKTDSYGEYIFDWEWAEAYRQHGLPYYPKLVSAVPFTPATGRSEEHTSELQSRQYLVCRLLLEKKNNNL